MSERLRLDVALEARGLVRSRARARDAVLRGTVSINGAVSRKPGQLVAAGDVLVIEDPAGAYVSRSALKLKAGLEATGWSPEGLVCLDLGASTGGFTQVLLEAGAARVYAVDVGHGQLASEVAADPRVVSLEGTDARAVTRDGIPEPIALLVCDVSFVSITKIIAAPSRLVAPDARAILLIKPQFEVGRDGIGKGGIVLPGPHVAAAQEAVIAALADLGWVLERTLPSPIAGGDGNEETIAAFTRTST